MTPAIPATPASRLRLLLAAAAALALAACGDEAVEPTYEADATDVGGGELIVTEADAEGVEDLELPETPMTPVPPGEEATPAPTAAPAETPRRPSDVRPLALAAALALALTAQPAAACTPAPGYRVPSNLEQVERAETIVLARVVAGALDEGGDPFESTITIRPLEALKGPLPEGDIALRGMMLSRDAGPELGMVSSPYEFERAHPVSYVGACTRFVFPLGTTALFFLRTDHEGRWAPAAEAFSRWAEDVPDRDAPWVALVRLYLRAATLPEGERAALLEGERAALLARADDPVAQLMAADVARQLAPPPPGDAYAQLGEEDPADVESSVEAALRKMRQAAIEAGN